MVLVGWMQGGAGDLREGRSRTTPGWGRRNRLTETAAPTPTPFKLLLPKGSSSSSGSGHKMFPFLYLLISHAALSSKVWAASLCLRATARAARSLEVGMTGSRVVPGGALNVK